MRVAGALIVMPVDSYDMLLTLIDTGPCSVHCDRQENSLYSSTKVTIALDLRTGQAAGLQVAGKRMRWVVLTGRQGVYSTCLDSSPST